MIKMITSRSGNYISFDSDHNFLICRVLLNENHFTVLLNLNDNLLFKEDSSIEYFKEITLRNSDILIEIKLSSKADFSIKVEAFGDKVNYTVHKREVELTEKGEIVENSMKWINALSYLFNSAIGDE